MTAHHEASDRSTAGAPTGGTPADAAIAQLNSARGFRARGELAQAEAAYREALRLRLDLVEAHNELGTLLWGQQRLAEARACHLAAIQWRPELTDSYNHLGNVLRDEGEIAAAIDAFRRALELNPNYGAAHCNLASILDENGWTEEALVEFRRAVELVPRDPDVLANYGVCLAMHGQLDEAIACYRRAIQLDGENPDYGSQLLYGLNFHPDYDPQRIFEEHRTWARQHTDPLTLLAAPHANDRTVNRRLRVGYVSSHFRGHAVNFFSEPILAAHDHRAVEVFCYNAALRSTDDATTERLRGYADAWRDIVGQGDQQAAELIRRDQIDVLVDLTGHIGGHRLLVFARQPAPVQVTYIGYQNTTGMQAMDYRLTDDWSDPPGNTDRYYTERLVRLPRTFFTYLPSHDAPDVTPLPALARRGVTFGSLNNFSKITPQVSATWAEILAAVPRSRLILLAPVTETVQDRVRQVFERQGVNADRVELARRRPRGDYLKLINRVDVALDPFPFTGHTTTCDCLWQGVPVVSLAGETYAARFGSSGLVSLGLRELVAESREEYVAIARRLAGDFERLAELRRGLRERMRHSPLLDSNGFTRNLEAAYRRMWTDWCVGGKN